VAVAAPPASGDDVAVTLSYTAEDIGKVLGTALAIVAFVLAATIAVTLVLRTLGLVGSPHSKPHHHGCPVGTTITKFEVHDGVLYWGCSDGTIGSG
jgi:hypothetical protein